MLFNKIYSEDIIGYISFQPWAVEKLIVTAIKVKFRGKLAAFFGLCNKGRMGMMFMALAVALNAERCQFQVHAAVVFIA